MLEDTDRWPSLSGSLASQQSQLSESQIPVGDFEKQGVGLRDDSAAKNDH